jgi:beta-phosphoglucomutase-like phosphatase (HAD superfamily)
MGITTTTSRSNLDALLTTRMGTSWRDGFAAVVNGEDVGRKKPDPEVYAIALEQIGVAPSAAVAIEDSPDGVLAAARAGIAVVVTRSCYFATDPMSGAMAVGPGLHTRERWTPAPDASPGSRIGLEDIATWHARHETTEPGRQTVPAQT